MAASVALLCRSLEQEHHLENLHTGDDIQKNSYNMKMFDESQVHWCRVPAIDLTLVFVMGRGLVSGAGSIGALLGPGAGRGEQWRRRNGQGSLRRLRRLPEVLAAVASMADDG